DLATGGAEDIRAGVGDDLHESLGAQVVQGPAHGSLAHAERPRESVLRQRLAEVERTVHDRVADALVRLPGQRGLGRGAGCHLRPAQIPLTCMYFTSR